MALRARLIRGAGLLLATLVLLALGTYIAGEQTEVVRLRTFDPDGTPHETKMWVVDDGGAPWVRVANPQRWWFRRLQHDPRAELIRGDRTTSVLARPHDDPATRRRIDERFREKYGLVDGWYGVLLRRHPIPIRLEPFPRIGSHVGPALAARLRGARDLAGRHRAARWARIACSHSSGRKNIGPMPPL